MKKIILLTAFFALIGISAGAQNYMVVNTEKIFKSIAAYNDANTTLETMGQQYQNNVDEAFAEVEKMYNDYMQQKPYLTEATRNSREQAILDREQEILEYQERIFGQEGELLKRRVELIQPIQDRVFQVINRYAESNGFAIVLDITNNPMVLYYSPSADKTDAIINLVK